MSKFTKDRPFEFKGQCVHRTEIAHADTTVTAPDVWLPAVVAAWFVVMAVILAWHGALAWAAFMVALGVGCAAVSVCMARIGGAE